MSTENNIEEKIRDIVLTVTRKPDASFTATTNFKDLEADSLDVVQILIALEDSFDIEIEDEEIKVCRNMGQLIAYIQKKQSEKKIS